MGLADYVVLGVIALIIGGALAYIIKAKRSGKRCIGCPDGAACSQKCSGGCASCTGCSHGKSE